MHYADELQVLVKWDDGQSSSLRMGRAHFKIVERAAPGFGISTDGSISQKQ